MATSNQCFSVITLTSFMAKNNRNMAKKIIKLALGPPCLRFLTGLEVQRKGSTSKPQLSPSYDGRLNGKV